MANQDEGDFWGKAAGRKPQQERPTEGFWAGGKQEPEAEEGFWSKAEAKKKRQREQAATPTDEQKRQRRRRRRRILLITGGSLLLLFLILIAIAPTVAGSFAPGIIERKAGEQIAGTVRVKDASFGWFGPQKITGFELRAPKEGVVVAANIEVGKGLFGFLTGNLDLGTVTLTGVKVDVVKRADGSTNLQDAVAPKKQAATTPAKDSGETRIPDSLKARVVARKMQVAFTDLSHGGREGSPTALIKNVDMDLTLAPGEPLKLSFDADAISGQQMGKIALDVDAQKLIRKDGLIQPARATVDASVELIGLPLALADALADLPEGASIRAGVGETIDVTIKAKGSLDDARAQLSAAAQNLQANGNLKIAKGMLTTESPLHVSVKGNAVRALVPQIDASLAADGAATLEAFPDLSVSVTDLKFPIPGSNGLDLRGAAGTVVLGVSETRGTVTITGERPEPFRIAPLEVRVESASVDQGAHVTAATSASISGQPAGDVNVDLRVAGLLDASGAPISGPPGTIEGAVSVRKIATAIAQPFLAAAKIDLPRDIGPTLDVEVRASADARGVAPGATPPAALTISVASEGLRVGGGVQVSSEAIRTSGDGLKLEVKRPVSIAANFVDPETGLRLAPTKEEGRGQGMIVTIKGLDVPRNAADGALLLDQARAQVDVALSGLVVESTAPAQKDALALNNTTIAAELEGGGANLTLHSAMVYAGQSFSAKATYGIAGLFTRQGESVEMTPPMKLRPVGKLELRDVPTRLAALFMHPEPASEGEQALDLPKLLADTLGATMTAAVTTAVAEGAPGTLNALVTVNTPTTIAEVNADVSDTQVALRKLAAQASVTPQTVSGLTQAFAPNVAGVPRLVGPARIIVQADPITVPMREFSPQLDRTGVAGLRLSIPGHTLVDGLQIRQEDGTLRDLGRVGVGSLEVAVKAPVAALVGPALPEERKVTATLSGTVLGGEDESLLVLNAKLDTEVSDSKLAGGLVAEARVSDVNTRLLEQFVKQDGLISGAIGNTLSAQLTANLTPPRDAAQGFDFTQATTDVRLELEAPRLRSDGPIQATVAAGAVTLAKPVRLVMDVEPAWVNKFFEKPLPPDVLAGKPPPPDVQLSRPTSATLAISKFTYPLGESEAARRAALETAVTLTIPALEMVTRDAQEVRLSQVVVGVDATPVRAIDNSFMSSVPVNLKLDVAEASVGDQPSAKIMTLRGSVTDLLDTRGNVSMDHAMVTLNGDLPTVPTAMVDALFNQNGLIVDALGPVASVKVQVERYPLGQFVEEGGLPPVVFMQAESQRARAEIRGTIREQLFVTERPLEVTIVELTDDLARRLIKGLPLLGTLSKNSKDAPALINGTNLTVPLSDDMSKLNGNFRIDPGEARFDTSTGIARFLKGQTQTGVVGRRLEPLNVRVVNGIATYERWSIPLGEFQVQTEGTVDLVQRTVNVVTYVPFSQLSESAASTLNTSLNQVLGKAGGTLVSAATMVPLRTSGPMNDPTTSLDMRLFMENLRQNLRPGDMLGDLLRQHLQAR